VTATGTTYSVTVTNSTGCTSAAATGTIAVHGLPTIEPTSGSTNQAVYAGTAISPIVYATTNATGADISGLPSGVSGTWSIDGLTISGTSAAAGTYNYEVTTKNDNGCDDATAIGIIYVDQPCSNCTTWTNSCGFTEITYGQYEATGTLYAVDALGYCGTKGHGWRLPTTSETSCMCSVRSTLPGGFVKDGYYWTDYIYTVDHSWRGRSFKFAVNCLSNIDETPRYVKCVK
jgi:hypothetical protein